MSLFAAALDSSDDDGNDSSLFSHSERNFTAIIAERQQKQAAAAEKKKAKAEAKLKRNAKRKSDAIGDGEEPQSASKRRPSLQPETGQNENIDDPNDETGQDVERHESVAKDIHEVSEHNGEIQYEDMIAKKHGIIPEASPAPIVIDDDEVLDATSPVNQQVDEDEYTDDEFAEIARQARLAQRRKKGSASIAKNTTSTTAPEAENKPNEQEHRDGPVVEILITSPIQNTNPLRVMFRLRKSLSILRQTWCQKQGLTPEMANHVFLTYRLRKIYDTSTCQSLGLYVDEYGEVKLRGAERKEGAEKVHLLAMTETDLEKARREKQTAENPQSMANEENVQPETVSGSSPTIRLLLKHPDLAPYKLIVKPTTLVAKIVKAYRKQYKIEEDATVRLSFDGDMLDEKAEMQHTEISDEDVIDVHFKKD